MKSCILGIALATLLLTGTLPAQVPALINYQGRVAVGATNFEGTGQFKFALVDSAGTTTYWSNDDTSVGGSQPTNAVVLTVTKGLYSVLLGDTSLGATMIAIPTSVFTNPDVRLRVWFSDSSPTGFQLLSPDQRLAPTAYLADGAVGSAKIADGAIQSAKIAPSQITAEHLVGGAVNVSHFGVPASPSAGQVLGYNGTDIAWINPGGAVFSLNGTNAYYNGGNVGIGTTSPATKLELRTGINEYGLTHTNGSVTLRTYIGNTTSVPSGGWFGTNSNSPLYLYVNSGAPGITLNTAGRVGIGTTTPSGALHVASGGFAVTGAGSPFTGAGQGLYLERNGATGGVFAFNYTNFTPLPLLLNAPGGNVGIGTSSPVVKLDVRGTGSTEATVGSTNERAIVSLNSTIGGSNRVWTMESGLFGTAGLFGIYDRTANRAGLTIDANGTVSVAVLRINGADVAEPFDGAEPDLPKGTVVVIDPTRPGGLKRSSVEYDTCVAGITSGANGVNSGIILSQSGVNEGGQNVAISGRVYVHADASNAPIKPGDLLTTSATPGHAMKVTAHARAQGAVIGKAMSSLNEGTGMVLVLVTLQ